METKLTLRMDEQLIERAKGYAKRSGKSLSQLVADYFAMLEADVAIPGTEITPNIRGLVGILKGSELTEEDYKKYLAEKYR